VADGLDELGLVDETEAIETTRSPRQYVVLGFIIVGGIAAIAIILLVVVPVIAQGLVELWKVSLPGDPTSSGT
jgi:hypothetical protein